MWHTMARCGAVRSLDLDDYDAEKQSLRFKHRPETGTPLKNKQTSERHVAISESLADLLDDWVVSSALPSPTNTVESHSLPPRTGASQRARYRDTRTSTPNHAGINGDARSIGTPRRVSRPSTPRSVAARSLSHPTRFGADRSRTGSAPTFQPRLSRIVLTSLKALSTSTTTSALTRRKWNSDGSI